MAKAMTLQMEARVRRLRLATFLVRIASLIRSLRLAKWAVGLIRLETRIDKGRWKDIGPLPIKVERDE